LRHGSAMSALLILNYDVLSEEGLVAYRQAAAPSLLGPGRGQLIASASDVEYLPEGTPQGTHTVILRFPDAEAARRTYHSGDYKPHLEARLRAIRPHFAMIVPTVE
jgi:uncharacterized protein (DUF1330 family)